MDLAEIPPHRGKQLAALRVVAGAPGGLRLKAYPTTMPLLVQVQLARAVPWRVESFGVCDLAGV
jgi:hypothetical protein